MLHSLFQFLLQFNYCTVCFSFSENYFTVKGAALILPQSDYETAFTRKATKSHGGKVMNKILKCSREFIVRYYS